MDSLQSPSFRPEASNASKWFVIRKTSSVVEGAKVNNFNSHSIRNSFFLTRICQRHRLRKTQSTNSLPIFAIKNHLSNKYCFLDQSRSNTIYRSSTIWFGNNWHRCRRFFIVPLLSQASVQSWSSIYNNESIFLATQKIPNFEILSRMFTSDIAQRWAPFCYERGLPRLAGDLR